MLGSKTLIVLFGLAIASLANGTPDRNGPRDTPRFHVNFEGEQPIVAQKPMGRKRIVGGTPIDIDKVPYAVQMTDTFGLFLCGGSIVAPNFIVSASHCVESRYPEELRIVAGASKLDEESGEKRKVLKIIMHPLYNANTLDMDVAVLKLDAPLPYGKKIQPIQFCSTPVKTGDVIQVSGWGLTHETNLIVENQLRTVRVPVIARDTCEKLQADVETPLTNSMFCASEAGTKDSCTGDSGGPAIVNGKLCGIVSWGVGCGQKQYPGIYTSVPVVREFIDKSLKE